MWRSLRRSTALALRSEYTPASQALGLALLLAGMLPALVVVTAKASASPAARETAAREDASATPADAHAADRWAAVATPEEPVWKNEISVGIDAKAHTRSAYATAVWSPFGDVRKDGWRLRTATGFSEYRYDGWRWDGKARVPMAFQGALTFTDAMVGYQATIGAWTVKTYLGGARVSNAVTPFDPDNLATGEQFGFKAALETWLSVGDWGFVQADLAWASVFDSYSGRLRTGLRLDRAWSSGFEAGWSRSGDHDTGRVGAFARFEWSRGEVSASTGLASDEIHGSAVYGTVGLLLRF